LEVRERSFVLPALTLAAREWGNAGERPVIALHGWLDNAGSFDRLAPLLEGCHLIALDAAGHGLSGNRSPDSGYNIWQDLTDLVEVAEQLGWERFSLLGHSRGAAVASLFAGTFPDRVERLVLVEGGLPIMSEARAAPENLAQAIQKSRELRTKSGRIFSAREQAIVERARGFSEVSEEAAEVLAVRSLREVEGGWQWHADQRLKAGSEVRLTREIVAEFLGRIEAPVQMFLAEQSPFSQRPVFLDMLEFFVDLELHRFPGRHHFHLEGAEAAIAERAGPFLAGS
jgi:pimeloyl-ACP methyl ester carboxylesterase